MADSQDILWADPSYGWRYLNPMWCSLRDAFGLRGIYGGHHHQRLAPEAICSSTSLSVERCVEYGLSSRYSEIGALAPVASRHRAPDPNCSCGYYLIDTPKPNSYPFMLPSYCQTVGLVARHEDGFRAAQVRVLALYLSDALEAGLRATAFYSGLIEWCAQQDVPLYQQADATDPEEEQLMDACFGPYRKRETITALTQLAKLDRHETQGDYTRCMLMEIAGFPRARAYSGLNLAAKQEGAGSLIDALNAGARLPDLIPRAAVIAKSSSPARQTGIFSPDRAIVHVVRSTIYQAENRG